MITASDDRKALANELAAVWKDRDFILGILCFLDNDEEVNQMRNFVLSKEWNEPYELTVKALMIDHNRKQD